MARTEDILAEYLAGSVSVDDLMTRYDIKTGSELEDLLLIAEQLEQVLVHVSPSPEFVATLRADLLRGDSETFIKRLRVLSPSLSLRQVGSLAAGIGGLTVAAGLLWYARRTGFSVRPRRDSKTPAWAS
jgi:hypothetical protein